MHSKKFELITGADFISSVSFEIVDLQSSQSIASSNRRHCGSSVESAGSHSPIGLRFHHAFSPIGAN
jgi:hypothetical protein